MRLKNDSLVFVAIGDWNRFYINSNWIKKNVYEKDEI